MSENKSKYVKLIVLSQYSRDSWVVLMDSTDIVRMTYYDIMNIWNNTNRRNRIANINVNNGYINVIEPIGNQLIVIKRTRDKSKYIVINAAEQNKTIFSTVSKEEILNNPFKYYNLTISNNRIYIKHKLERAYQMGKQIEDYINLQNYAKKALVIGDESILDISYNNTGNKIICNGYANKHYIGEETLVIPNFVNIIGSGAFNAKNIEQLILGELLESIEDRAFQYCIHLKSIKFNNKLKHIAGYAFKGCTLERIDLGNTSIESLEYDAFLDELNRISNGRDLVEELIFPRGLKEIKLPHDWHQHGDTLRFPYGHVKKIVLPYDYKNLKLIDKSVQSRINIKYNKLELQSHTIKLDDRKVTLEELKKLIFIKNIHLDFLDVVKRSYAEQRMTNI